MARYRKAAAVALNSAILIVEAIAGWQADSLSLLMDSVHNLSDEMALVLIFLAFVLPLGVSRYLLRSANIFNSAGLVLISAFLLWQAVDRLLHPAPVAGAVAIMVGLAACGRHGRAGRWRQWLALRNLAIQMSARQRGCPQDGFHPRQLKGVSA